jgi:anti-sigma regulatory factor (Ser/Thr protein kinase)
VLNALEHGGASFVTMSLGSEADPRLLVFEDDGVSFDPATRSMERRSDKRGGVCPRGRGLILVRSSTRHIEHRRDNGRNRLTVLLVE